MSTVLESTDLRADILRLKEERNAVLLVHNYQVAEIQELGDYVGDSLGLAFRAPSKTRAPPKISRHFSTRMPRRTTT